ncbi:MAG: Mevalonate kinase [Methanonatronarchaeales archaeon]|nr:Mevalonate kinase [Methanonatronarchaeales archaeon]
MIQSSAPAKVYLFGEHAVVYGEPAVAAAVDLRARVQLEERGDSRIRVEARNLDSTATIDHDGDLEGVDPFLRYVFGAAKSAGARGLNVTTDSDIPVGSGLGSSAAVTVATIHAASRHAGLELSREEIASLAHGVERDVQGSASPTDTYVSTMGGVNVVETGRNRFEQVDTGSLDLVAGDTGETGATGELVEMVGDMSERFPSVRHVIKTIGEVSRDGLEALESGDTESVGVLMDVNHGLLEALGVSTPRLSSMVHSARTGGASGAKITGAGGGGCIVALGSGRSIESAIEEAGGEALPLSLDRQGVVSG